MRHETAGRMLKFACLFTAIVGLGMAALSFEAADGITGALTGLVFGESTEMVSPLSRLLAGVVGGVLAGWAVTMWMVVDRIHPQNPALVRAILVPGLVVWFVVDGIGSVVSGGALNVVGNMGFVVLFGIPLVLGPTRVAAER
jgi:hypothetical protein